MDEIMNDKGKQIMPDLLATLFDSKSPLILLEFSHPASKRRERRKDKERTFCTVYPERCNERDANDGLPKTHLISKDTIHPILVNVLKPLHAIDLIIFQRTFRYTFTYRVYKNRENVGKKSNKK